MCGRKVKSLSVELRGLGGSATKQKTINANKNCFVNIIFGIRREHNFWCVRDERAIKFKFSYIQLCIHDNFQLKICRTGDLHLESENKK